MKKIPIITGPTASGKSTLLYELLDLQIDFEIVSADAFQIYKGLDIGTAKPSLAMRSKVAHHLIDIIPTDGAYTAGDFVNSAEDTIEDILARGKIPIVSGGTGLYVQSLRDGIFETPPSDEEYREVLRRRAEVEGSKALHDELSAIDAVTAQRVHQNDLVRIIRGLEVWKLTGVPLSVAHEKFKGLPRFQYDVMVIQKDREELYADINDRVLKMLEEGWLQEVEDLLKLGYTSDLPSFRAIGYRELADVLGGKNNLPDAVELIAQRTRNYAKRQMTWFRGMSEAKFMSNPLIISRMKELY